MKTRWMAWGLGLAALGLAACSGTRREIGKQTKVLSLPDKAPAWLQSSKAFFEDGGRLFYMGAAYAVEDPSLGVREATGEASKNLAGEVRQLISAEFTGMKRGQNAPSGLGQDTVDFVRMVTSNVAITGAKLTEQYLVKNEEQTAAGVRYSWDCHALVSVSKEDYLAARSRVLEDAIAQARSQRNAKVAAELDALRQKLDGAPSSDARAAAE